MNLQTTAPDVNYGLENHRGVLSLEVSNWQVLTKVGARLLYFHGRPSCGMKRLMKEFPAKRWKKTSLNDLCPDFPFRDYYRDFSAYC